MRLLVTGGAGTIGSMTTALLPHQRHTVALLDFVPMTVAVAHQPGNRITTVAGAER